MGLDILPEVSGSSSWIWSDSYYIGLDEPEVSPAGIS